MTVVTLTPTEVAFASYVGTQRRQRALANGRQHRHGYDGANNWSVHIEAAGAELALAKLLNRYYVDSYDPDYQGDVGSRTQVRHTVRRDGRLIVHRDDPDDHAYVLITGELPVFTLHGWIYARDAKRDEWWVDPGTGRPAYFVPQTGLRELPDRRPA